jgi:hypothetical protein
MSGLAQSGQPSADGQSEASLRAYAKLDDR